MEREKYELALEDLEAALEREPRNGNARRQLQEIRILITNKAAAAAGNQNTNKVGSLVSLPCIGVVL